MIFLKSTEAEYQYPESELIIPQQARDFIDQILKIDPKDRPTISEMLSHPYFENVSPTFPEIKEEDQVLADVKTDILRRANVHKLESQEVFEENMRQSLVEKIGQEWYDRNTPVIDHIIKLGKGYVYDVEWSFD